MKKEKNINDFVSRNIDDYGDILDARDVKNILKISFPTAYSLLTDKNEKGKIKAFKIKTVWKIPKKEFIKFLEDRFVNIKNGKGKSK